MKIYRCDICSNILLAINDSGVTPHCCNSEMVILMPEETSLVDEHYIKCSLKDMENYAIVSLYVGKDRLHPMNEDHHLEWAIVNTNKGHSYTDSLWTIPFPTLLFLSAKTRSLSVSEYTAICTPCM